MYVYLEDCRQLGLVVGVHEPLVTAQHMDVLCVCMYVCMYVCVYVCV